ALEWGGEGAVLVGCSAAAMHGAVWMEGFPAEILVPRRARPPANVLVCRDVIAEEEIVLVDGLRCTTPVRTAFDIGRRRRGWLAVALLDSLFRATELDASEVEAFTKLHPGARNCRKLLELLAFTDAGAESIQESRLRLLLQRAGLPRPETQIPVQLTRTAGARLDMGYRRWMVGVEYEGAQHWSDPRQFTHDIDRYNLLATLGWIIIRVDATLLRDNPREVIAKATAALHSHGYTSPSGTPPREIQANPLGGVPLGE
ncbi:endonuclease domain-containing protein, partial [Nocardia sp. JMUB6875]|uniref:endonuclease domain-containing protein n=1 Tax=Nocardia sp. JMUB6875 TaxID=3158170 RepID=UPI0034E8C72F